MRSERRNQVGFLVGVSEVDPVGLASWIETGWRAVLRGIGTGGRPGLGRDADPPRGGFIPESNIILILIVIIIAHGLI